MDLRAKLARLRSMEPPAALFEPPPPPPAAALRSVNVSDDVLGRALPVVDVTPSGARADRIAKLRALIGEVAARYERRTPPPPPAANEKPPWSEVLTAHGPLHVHERYLEPDHHHGRAAVRAGACERPAALCALLRDPNFAAVDLTRALYLDTETTGLAGGTGTVAFLVGLARFDDGVLCVEQLIVPQLGSETPVLARLAERIAAASCIVTYNGKSFDWPLLRTRFVLARLPVPELPPHIDLLHVCRRVWKPRLPSLRLPDMEREVLCFEREDDLPGSEIPARYFEFLRGGSPDRLVPVLEHNQNDLIALSALLGAVLEHFDRARPLPHPRDALSFARLALAAGDLASAELFGDHALEHAETESDRFAALTFRAALERQRGDTPRAIALLSSALGCAPGPEQRAAVHFKLAKLYEHEVGDLARALAHARGTEPVEGPLLHGRRLGRLVRRLLRQDEAGSAGGT